MSNQTILLGLVGIAAGVAGAATTIVLVDDGPATTTAVSAVPDTSDATVVRDLKLRLDWLEQQNTRFSERIQELEVFAAEGDAVSMEPRELADASDAHAEKVLAFAEAVPQEQLVESVGEALETIRAQEDAERDARRAERRAERIDERMAELAEALSLDAYQSERMRTWMDESETARDELRDEMRENRDRDEMREKFDELRASGLESLGEFLTPYQVEQFGELDTGGRGRGRRGGGGGGGGGFGGGDI